jgi:uncharacterized protein YjiS (DUF1127 family)
MSSIQILCRHEPASAVAREMPRGRFDRALSSLRRWLDRADQRAALNDLDDYLLRDIGITRAEAQAETRKLFWQA